jgi:hypothetical protein
MEATIQIGETVKILAGDYAGCYGKVLWSINRTYGIEMPGGDRLAYVRSELVPRGCGCELADKGVHVVGCGEVK